MLFRFKEFTVRQDKCAMKVGTDGVLLGSWTLPPSSGHILDIGTGSGLLSLMLAQKSSATIHAIDNDINAFNQARENFELSPWNKQIKAFNLSFQDYLKESSQKYDLIISNPPYFHNSFKPFDKARLAARHNDSLLPEELFRGVAFLLKPQAIFNMVFPSENHEQLEEIANLNDLKIKNICFIKPTPNKEANRILYSFCRTGETDYTEEEELVIEKNGRHQYSPEYIALTQDYYLNF